VTEPEGPYALVVEDKGDNLLKYRSTLENLGFVVKTARNSVDATDLLTNHGHQLDLLLVDLHLEASNAGWRVVAHSLKPEVVPIWCERVILTGYTETEAAAKAVPVSFFKKGDWLECKEHLRLVAESAKARRNGLASGLPAVTPVAGQAELSYDEEITCKAVTSASEIMVLGRPKGSLQKDSVLLTARIRPVDGGAQYVAIVKRSSSKKIGDERRGYAKLSQYFANVGEFIPPSSIFDSLTTRRDAILVTPQVEGKTLYEVAQDYWVDEVPNRIELFQSTFTSLRHFLDGVREIQSVRHVREQIIVESYLGDSDEARRRQVKTLPVLSRFLPADKAQVRFEQADLEIVNPHFLFGGRDPIPWWPDKLQCGMSHYGHGDFHVGNILISVASMRDHQPKHVFVLDYDYVGPWCKYYDTAQLETSFLMAIATQMQSDEKWETRLRPALLRLAGDGLYDVPGMDRSWVDGLLALLSEWRGVLSRDSRALYDACLVTTMLRVFTQHAIQSDNLPPSTVRVGLGYVGLLLKKLVDVSKLPGTVKVLNI
jgi:CheY-like chemotaxis protein